MHFEIEREENQVDGEQKGNDNLQGQRKKSQTFTDKVRRGQPKLIDVEALPTPVMNRGIPIMFFPKISR